MMGHELVTGSPSAPTSCNPGPHDDANVDADLSTDDQKSLSSGGETAEGDLLDGRQSKTIDRIMRSFCASLDLKIAAIKTTPTAATIKTEPDAKRRETVACLACRGEHLKCDGNAPCSSCATYNKECLYVTSRRDYKVPTRNTVQNTNKNTVSFSPPYPGPIESRPMPLGHAPVPIGADRSGNAPARTTSSWTAQVARFQPRSGKLSSTAFPLGPLYQGELPKPHAEGFAAPRAPAVAPVWEQLRQPQLRSPVSQPPFIPPSPAGPTPGSPLPPSAAHPPPLPAPSPGRWHAVTLDSAAPPPIAAGVPQVPDAPAPITTWCGDSALLDVFDRGLVRTRALGRAPRAAGAPQEMVTLVHDPAEVFASDTRNRRRKNLHSRQGSDLTNLSTRTPPGSRVEEACEATVLYGGAPPPSVEAGRPDQGAYDIYADGDGDVLVSGGPGTNAGALPSHNMSLGAFTTYQDETIIQARGPGYLSMVTRRRLSFEELDDAMVTASQPDPPSLDYWDRDYVPRVKTQLDEAFEEPQAVQATKSITQLERPQQGIVHDVLQKNTDGDGRRKKAKRGSLDVISGTRKFACPYFKRNPRKYRTWTSCPGPGWDEVHRVKTHLYRRHPLPIQCPRCWQAFKIDGQLRSHLQQDPPCAIQDDRTVQEGFTKDQEKRLRSRKKTHADMTDEDKWREIYVILFPDDEQTAIPSPYYSEADRKSSIGGLNGSGELEDYATFIRREMPTLVRRELEALFRDQFQDVEERLRPRIAEIVLNLQPKLLGLYRQSQVPLSEYGPQPYGDAASGSEPALTPVLSQGTDPSAGTGTDSTPAAVLGPDSVFAATDTQLGFCESNFDTDWDALQTGNQAQTQPGEVDAELGLNWEFEFGKLLNPALFMSQCEEIPTLPVAQAAAGRRG